MTDAPSTQEPAGSAAQTVAAAPSVLRDRNFLLLWLAQAFSQIGQNALILGLLVLVQRLTQSPTHLSLATLALVAPSVVFSLLAGVVVDHLNKRSVLLAANVLRAVASVLFLVLDRSLGLLYVVAFLFSTVGQFFAPAEAAAIPMLVRKEQLMTANSLFNLTLSGSQLLGLVIVAPLAIKLLGLNGFFVLLALLFALAALCVAFLPRDEQAGAGLSGKESQRMVRDVWVELREGWRILRTDGVAMFALVNLTLMASLIPLLAVLGPAFSVGVIRAGAEDVVYLFAPAGVAMVITAAFVGKLVARVGKMRLVIVSLASMGLTLLLLGAAKTGGGYLIHNMIGRVLDTRHIVFELIPIVMALSFALGVEFVCIWIPAQTLLQERCPADFRGRIFGVQFTLSGAGSILPLLGAGAFADVFGVNKTIFLLGAALFGIAIVIGQKVRKLAAATT